MADANKGATAAATSRDTSDQIDVNKPPPMSLHPSPSSSTPPKEHRREFWGWLSYAFASEVFVIVSLTLFLPICLEQFARDNGFLLPNKTIPCSSSPAPPVGTAQEDHARCVVKLGWAWIDTASFRYVGFRILCICCLPELS